MRPCRLGQARTSTANVRGAGFDASFNRHPDVPLETARERHRIARSLLADGIDPSDRKGSDGKYTFATGRGVHRRHRL